jgi:hypothetical protein
MEKCVDIVAWTDIPIQNQTSTFQLVASKSELTIKKKTFLFQSHYGCKIVLQMYQYLHMAVQFML